MNTSIAEKIALLNRVTLESLGEQSKPRIIKKFTEVGLKIVGADFGFAWWRPAITADYTLVYKSSTTPYHPNPPRQRGGNYQAQKSGRPFFVSDVRKERYENKYDVRPYMKSYVIIPIIFQNRSYGNIILCFKRLKRFSGQDKSLCEALGNALAQAITITGLYIDLKDFKNTLDNTLDSIFIFDAQQLKMLYVNQGAMKLTGLKRKELLRKNLHEIITGLSETELTEKITTIFNSPELQSLMFESTITHPERGKIPVEISLQYVVQSGEVERFLAIVRDISERKQSEDTIKKMAYFDTLTGLPNRALLNERLAEEFQRAQEKAGMFAVLFIDLDRFKVINDIFGHHAGDALLKQVSARLLRIIPRRATICRMGGDEFMILLPKIKGILEAQELAVKIQALFLQPYVVDEQEIYANCSIGMAAYPLDGADTRTVLKNADAALHRAKEFGGNTYQHYTAGLPLFYSMQPLMERQLRQAIKKNELRMQYQPVIDVVTQRVIGAEGLLRWQHPERGLLYPDSFIQQAEESGLIVAMGEWIIEEVCRQIKQWQKDKVPIVPISINVSPRELLRPTYVDMVAQTLKRYNIDPAHIKLELTETFLMKNIDLSISILEQIQMLGVDIIIDDFGTGYASLNYLKRLPIDGIKIDKTFVHGSTENIQDAALTTAIIAIAHQLGLLVVAEGVESDEQYMLLAEHECDAIQGNRFYKPLDGQELGNLLAVKAG